MTRLVKRLAVTEYGSPVDLNIEVATTMGITKSQANSLLNDAGNRIALQLGLKENVISIDSKGVRAYKFAGIVQISPLVELEVSPKFLNNIAGYKWQDDFYFISNISKYGQLLPYDKLLSSATINSDLLTLLAESFVTLYESNKRFPLRSYRRQIEESFSIMGKLDPIDIFSPSINGFRQEVLYFDKSNEWNACILAASKVLLSEVTNPIVNSFLLKIVNDLLPQKAPLVIQKPLPARHKAWKLLYELSIDILSGFGGSYSEGVIQTSGYIVSTWQIWQDLLKTGITLSFGNKAVKSQFRLELGSRYKNLNSKKMNVLPDLLINIDNPKRKFILDAKYKGHIEKGALRILESDIYESIAFSIASNCKLVILAYPLQSEDKIFNVGECIVFEKVIIQDIKIIGIGVEIRGISQKGGLKKFSEVLFSELNKIIQD